MWYVEPLNEATCLREAARRRQGTPLADYFSSLLFVPLRLLVDPVVGRVRCCLVGLAKPQYQMGVLKLQFP